MMNPLRMYGESLLSADAEAEHWLRLPDGAVLPLPLDRYLGPADATDEQLLSDVVGPVLDVGCGPGRHLKALAARGVFALGVDLSPAAVALATGGGAKAIAASIFDELPGSGTWRSALLLDGNVGIGGAPERLLSRIATLLCDDGEVLIELDPPDTPTGPISVRIESDGSVSGWFPWARLSVAEVGTVARAGGFEARRAWSSAGRWFAWLSRRAPVRSR